MDFQPLLINNRNTNPDLVAKLLSYVHPITLTEAENKLMANEQDNLKFLSGNFNGSLEIYFSFFSGAGMGSLKFNNQGVKVRKRLTEGLKLIEVPSYFEFSDISLLPELRGHGLVKHIYKHLMEYLSTNLSEDGNLLIGGVGVVREGLSECYSKGIFKKDQDFIPFSVIPVEIINNLEKVRDETISTKRYAEKMGLNLIGSSKTHGGPIFFTSSIFNARNLLYQSLESKI